jgi:hypothetical protein
LVREIETLADREVAALVVSALTLGRASLIIPAARSVLSAVGTPIAERLRESAPGGWRAKLDGFRYRFFSGIQVSNFLDGIGEVLREQGTLEAAFGRGGSGWEGLRAFADLFSSKERDLGILIPVEGSAGAFKRLNLFLRWMVRRDCIDPGGWSVLEPSKLFMPIDTHVLQWARREGLTQRAAADQKSCQAITAALRELCPEDPLRYDFAITRQGMENKKTMPHF